MTEHYIGYFHYACGAAFIALGIAALVLPSQNRRLHFAPHLWLLGIFGILRGVHEALHWHYMVNDTTLSGWASAIVALVAYLSFFEFGRRSLFTVAPGVSIWQIRALPGYTAIAAVIALFVVWADQGIAGLSTGAQYGAGITAAIVTGVATLQTSHRIVLDEHDATIRNWLRAAGIASICYAVLLLNIRDPDINFPQWIPTEQGFMNFTGVPMQILHGTAALIAALALLIITRLDNQLHYRDLDQVLDILSGYVYRCQNDADYTVLYMAGNVEEVLGYPISAFLHDRTITLADLIHPEDAERVWDGVQSALANKQNYELYYRIIHRDGNVRQIQERGNGVFDIHGELSFLQGHITDVTELARANERLESAEAHAHLGHWEFDVRTRAGYWSREMYRLLDHDEKAGVPDTGTYMSMLHPDDRDLVINVLRSMTEGRDPRVDTFRSNPERGPVKYFQPTWFSIRDHEGNPVRYAGTLQDVTDTQKMLDELKYSESRQSELLALARREQSRMAALLSAMSIGILFEDRDGIVEYVNPAFMRMWAIDEEIDLTGQPTSRVLEQSTQRFSDPEHKSEHVLCLPESLEISERLEIELNDGRVLTQLSYPVSEGDGVTLGRLWVFEDVTNERRTAQQLVYLAEHDPLTGLYNRHRFQEHLEWMIRSAHRNNNRFAVLYFDLDDFKYINDTFGHRAGDTVLVRTAGEISSLVRSGELFARLGGDEFAVLTELGGSTKPEKLAERIAHTVSSIPFRFRGNNFRLTTSIGITVYPIHGDNGEDLIAHADTAMYQAKSAGKNTWAVYDPDRDRSHSMMARMTWVSRISQAIEQGLFELHFQGVYKTADNSLSHLEALVRMKDPADPEKLIMPGQFIPIAEKSGHIIEIDRWVLRQSIATLAANSGLPALSVNVSGRSFDKPTLVPYIQALLEEYEVAPQRLIVELTETAAVSEMQDAQRFIESLQQTGCMVCLDDFGTGFSTFAYLKYLAVQVLKIDGMFIRDLPDHKDNQAVVKAMVDVAHGLDKLTVAEFVEDNETLDMLRALGVDMVQGYYLDRPSASHPTLVGNVDINPTLPSSAD